MNEEVYWYCHSCGYEWRAIRFESNGVRRCPRCDGTNLTPGTEDKSWKDIRLEIRKRDRFTCQICGAQKGPNLSLAVHHICPVSRGGLSKPDNLILLCSKCHEWEHKLSKMGIKAEYTDAGISPLAYFIVGTIFMVGFLFIIAQFAISFLWLGLIPLTILFLPLYTYLTYRRRLKIVRVKQLRLKIP